MEAIDKAMMALRELNLFEPDEIAEKMRQMGIKGIAFNARCCPIANWLKVETGKEFAVMRTKYACFDDDYQMYTGDIPLSVSKFIKRFDAGRYLFLDDNRI